MTSTVKNTGQMLVYQWKLKDLPSKFSVMTEMVEVLNMKVFRFGLKNEGCQPPMLYCVATNLHKLGLQVLRISMKTKPRTDSVEYMIAHDHEAPLQLFTKEFVHDLDEDVTITFNIHVVETTQHYCYQLGDVLLKKQLWAAAKNQQWTDVEFTVKGHLHAAHRAIVAARSPVLAAIFAGKDHAQSSFSRIKIHDTEPGVFEHFLRFLYTGEFDVACDCHQLIKVADKFQVLNLKFLCQSSSRDIDASRLTSFAIAMKPDFQSYTKKPKTELRGNAKSSFSFQKYSFVLEFSWRIEELPSEGLVTTSHLFQFKNEGVFRAGLVTNTGKADSSPRPRPDHILYLACTHVNKTGTQLEHVESMTEAGDQTPMDHRGEKSLQVFSQELYSLTGPATFTFNVKIREMIDNYRYQLVDAYWSIELWSACHENLFTDIEFVVEGQVFVAHRAVVAARSPVLAAIFNNCLSNETMTGRVHVDDIDRDTFAEFLYFLYTGTLLVSPNNLELLKVAQKYQVETLKDLCFIATQTLDVEDLTTSLIWL